MKSHSPATTKDLKEVKSQVVTALQHDKAQQVATASAEQIRSELLAGKTLAQLADAQHLTLKKVNGLARNTSDLSPLVSQAVFKAAKPQAGKASVVVIDDVAGGKIVANIVKVTEGSVSEADKAKLPVIEKNMATAFGKAQFEAVLNALQAKTDIAIREEKQQ
jgi:peptidyl-prolyl cis-trans isomerase D